jgi:hypothetical protein
VLYVSERPPLVAGQRPRAGPGPAGSGPAGVQRSHRAQLEQQQQAGRAEQLAAFGSHPTWHAPHRPNDADEELAHRLQVRRWRCTLALHAALPCCAPPCHQPPMTRCCWPCP